MSAALLRMGCTEPVGVFIDWYAPYQREDGFVPCCVDHNGADWLDRCLSALVRDARPAVPFEVVVVDNGSDEATRAVLERWVAPDAEQEERRGAYLRHLDDHSDAVLKAGPPEHFTASCIVLDATGEQILLTHHKRANAWFQFGGHLETGDASDCKVWLRRVGPWLIVDDNLACGGLNVSFRGLYRRQP